MRWLAANCHPRVVPAASLKPGDAVDFLSHAPKSSAGSPRGLIEACPTSQPGIGQNMSSAGSPRGLIEAVATCVATERSGPASSAGSPRGLIEAGLAMPRCTRSTSSSAGSPRGLIEASSRRLSAWQPATCHPRVVPAASLKHGDVMGVGLVDIVIRG